MSPTFYSLFAGVGGFDLGLEQAGFTCIGQVEIEPFCQAVLKKHWPEVPLHNDVRTAVAFWEAQGRPQVDLVCGGFPCQDVSVAGLRRGMHHDDGERTRTGLFFDALSFVAAVRPRAVLLENVPGLLTSNGGRDFGVILSSLVEVGYPYLEWRVLDSQHFGVPQRRRRVFVVASTGDPHGGPVLLEREGGLGDPEACEQEGAHAAGSAAGSTRGRGEHHVGALTTGSLSKYDDNTAQAGHLVRARRGVLADTGVVTSLTAALGSGGPDLAHAQAGWIFPADPQDRAAPSGHPDPAGTITGRIAKGINSSLDDGALVTADRAAPRRRVVRRRQLA